VTKIVRRLSRAAGLGLVCALLAACTPSAAGPPTYGDTTVMGMIQKRGVLRVGVLRDSFPFSFVHNGAVRGFEVDWATAEAKSLGVKMKAIPASPDRLVSLTDAGRVDMSFPNLPVTEAEIKPPGNLAKVGLPPDWPASGAQFVDPFWVGHQRLLVRNGSGITQVNDLEGKKVCAVLDPATEPSPDKIDSKVRVVMRDKPSQCVPLLRSGKVAAATSSDINLMVMMSELNKNGKTTFKLSGDQLSTEGYGILVAGTSSAGWLDHLNSFYGSTNPMDRWVVLYRKWLAGYHPMQPPIAAPGMSTGEAASIFPNQ
jgi:polar amino acid transport system substrate-binding protein